MFYISQLSGDICTVMDTNDWVSESYSSEEVLNISQSVKIHGVNNGKISVFTMEELLRVVETRDKLSKVFNTRYDIYRDSSGHELGGLILRGLTLQPNATYHVPDGVRIVAENVVSYSGVARDVKYVIHLPASCKKLQNSAFSGTGITKINLENVVEMGNSVFSVCPNLREVKCCRAVKIGGNAFQSSGIVRADLGMLEEISPRVFSGCKNLESVTAINIRKIGTEAFKGCKKLRLFTGNLSEAEIDETAFIKCQKFIR